MTEIYAIILFLAVLFLLLGTGVWVGLALMGVAEAALAMYRLDKYREFAR